MEEPRFDPFDYVSAFNRRKWWFIVPVVASVVIGLLLVWLLPRTYQSAAVLGSPRVDANLIGGGTPSRNERIRAISQQLLSRPVLARTAQLEGLDQQGDTDGAIDRLRRGLEVSFGESTIKGNLTPDQRAALDAYRVNYTDATPDDAQRILNRVVTVFVEENSKQRQMRAQDTSELIAGQLRTSEERLKALEAKLREAKESYMGRLPEQTSANLQMVSNLQRQLESTAMMMRAENDRLSALERQIEAMQQGADAGPVTGSAPSSGSSQARVLQLHRELADAQLGRGFTDKHPDVIRLKEELASAEKAAAEERAKPMAERMPLLQSSPEYRQLLKDREAATLHIAQLRRQQANAEAGIRQYQSRVEAAPRVEQELVSLQRAYDLERAAYGELTEKRQAALLNEELQRNQGDERFAVIAAASYPGTPFSPKPMRVLLMAIAAGFVLGTAGVMGREYLDRSVHDARGLRDEFELPVLAEIPRIDPVIS
jgi:succinoglycan biosynthesis transport protein ExoP